MSYEQGPVVSPIDFDGKIGNKNAAELSAGIAFH